jgi:hypothetical protein
MNPFTHNTTKPMTNIEFLQPYDFSAADALLKIDMAVISVVLSLAGTMFSKIFEAIPLLQRCGVSHQSTLSDAGHVSCRKHFLSAQILLLVGVLLSYSVLPCQDTHC